MTEEPTPAPVLRTARLILRPLSPDDAAVLHPVLADADVMRWWSSGPHSSVEETRAYLTHHPGEERWRSWAITRIGDDTAIGWVSAGARRQGVTEIGYILNPAAGGQGLAAEAVGAVVERLFARDGQRRIMADVDPDNHASIALLERLGFVLEGRLREEWETHIGVRDSLIFGLIARDWSRRRGDRKRQATAP